MTLREKQVRFLFDLSQLIQWALRNGFELTAGEMYRPEEMQKIYVQTGRSKTMNSRHLVRLAADFNIFKDGRLLFQDKSRYTEDVNLALPLGKYWMSLHIDNVWGADWDRDFNVLEETFRDPYHFERKQ